MRIKFRWYHAYLLLAALDLATVSGSLLLTGRLARESDDFFRIRQEWAEIHDDFLLLGPLTSNIDAPGNRIFLSLDPKVESRKLREAIDEFSAHATRLQQRLARHDDRVAVGPLAKDLEKVMLDARQMTDSCRAVIEAYAGGSRDDATRIMADMDRQLQALISQISAIGVRVTAIKATLYTSHQAAIQSLHRLERVIGALLIVMIAGATWYGLRSLREQRRIEAALHATNTELEIRVAARTAEVQAGLQARDRLLQGVFSAQEEERRRIARELHDGIGQQLATLLLRMQLQTSLLTDQHCRAALEEMRHLVAETMQEVRQMSQGLRPSVLDDLGLVPALQRLVADINRTGLMQAELQAVHPPAERMAEEIETAIYRIAQEAVSNLLKHSQATRACIELDCSANAVKLTIIDDGLGFDPDTSDGGLGLPGMRERANLLDGQLMVDSRPGQGTRVNVTIPLS